MGIGLTLENHDIYVNNSGKKNANRKLEKLMVRSLCTINILVVCSYFIVTKNLEE